ncbi:MAG: AAA family ATPase [Candidatus Hadarchaeum sp.]
MPDETNPLFDIAPGVASLIELAKKICQEHQHSQLGLYHWMLAILERNPKMVETLSPNIDVPKAILDIQLHLKKGNCGEVLEVEALLSEAETLARNEQRERIYERDLIKILLGKIELPQKEGEETVTAMPSGWDNLKSRSEEETRLEEEEFKTLRFYGRDLIEEARQGKLTPVVGREEEINLVIEVLHRHAKRNPVLIGPAGVGKTAIVEGLAQRIVNKDVPERLRNVRLFAIQPSHLVIGLSSPGEFEKRLRDLIHEANHPNVILFIDEVHSMIGVGGYPSLTDFASQLKPSLSRGEITCIAATTDDEYRRFIENDAALERRFLPVRVQEPTPEETMEILIALREPLATQRGVQVSDELLRYIIEFAGQFMKNRFFPDKAIDLFDQCIAYAATHETRELTHQEVQIVLERMIGMPINLSENLKRLRQSLERNSMLDKEARETLISRLQVTLRGLDVRPNRPNAVLLLGGEAAALSEILAMTISETLFGSAQRVVRIDFSRFVHPADITMLIGASPGYVGYGQRTPLHQIVQTPWCTLICENIDACHEQILPFLRQALASGIVTDGTGKNIYLSDTIIILTARSIQGERQKQGMGFIPGLETHPTSTPLMDEELMQYVDIFFTQAVERTSEKGYWINEQLLQPLKEIFELKGFHLIWEESFIQWAKDRSKEILNQREWERFVDEHISAPIVAQLPEGGRTKPRTFYIRVERGKLKVEEAFQDPASETQPNS